MPFQSLWFHIQIAMISHSVCHDSHSNRHAFSPSEPFLQKADKKERQPAHNRETAGKFFL